MLPQPQPSHLPCSLHLVVTCALVCSRDGEPGQTPDPPGTAASAPSTRLAWSRWQSGGECQALVGTCPWRRRNRGGGGTCITPSGHRPSHPGSRPSLGKTSGFMCFVFHIQRINSKRGSLMTLQIVDPQPGRRLQFRLGFALTRSPKETGIRGKEEWVSCVRQLERGQS